jgi:hypothetical protein
MAAGVTWLRCAAYLREALRGACVAERRTRTARVGCAQTTQQQLDAERARAWALDEELSTARTALERKRGKKKGWKGRAEQAEPALTLAQQHLSDRTTELKEYAAPQRPSFLVRARAGRFRARHASQHRG